MTTNLLPLPYRRVSVQHVSVSLDEPAIRGYLLGKEAYRRTDYIVLRGEAGQAVVRVEKAEAEPLFSSITAVEVLALPDTCVWVEDPAVDVGNPSAMATKAHALGLGPQGTLIVEGLYSHVNFLHYPEPLVIRAVEVAPPEPPKLFALARKVLSYADLPAIVLESELIDLSAAAGEIPAPAYLFPCRASGLIGPGPTYYLDGRPARRDWLLIGCERSLQVHRHFYGDEPATIEMCPRRLAPPADKPTLLKCCLLESGIEVDGQTVIVPWGATLQQVEEGLRALVGLMSTSPSPGSLIRRTSLEEDRA
ncbi:MAG: hypothetical protein M5U01_28770 [Ardenticatenaceae bacterium]|nr:hypothetical protein [Ardenticatenaceae bacterium]